MPSGSGERGTRSRRLWQAAALGALALAGFALAAGAAMLALGVYDTAATNQHLKPTFALLDIGLRRSVEARSKHIEVPVLEDAARVARGYACFKAHCEQCHGGPGVGRAAFALGLLPVPSSLSQSSADWSPAELYWITRKGIKMTGMPAWEYRFDDDALWAVVAFLQVLPRLGPDEYRTATGSGAAPECETPDAPGAQAAADPVRGQRALQQYGCTACHVVPGIVGPDSHTGPPLRAMGQRKYIAGVLPNTRENMVRWLLDPRAVSARTAMPSLGLTEPHARDIAAYLATLR
jgi:mono/diheme cytochrome c family protein